MEIFAWLSLDDKRISSSNHHMIIWVAAFLFHQFPEHCLIFTPPQNVGWCLFFALSALFYCQRLLAVWFIFKPRCHVRAWYGIREKGNLSPSHCLLPLPMFHSEITKSNSVCQSSSPIWALKRSHLVQDLPRRMEDKQGWGWVIGFPSSLL